MGEVAEQSNRLKVNCEDANSIVAAEVTNEVAEQFDRVLFIKPRLACGGIDEHNHIAGALRFLSLGSNAESKRSFAALFKSRHSSRRSGLYLSY